VPVVLSASGRGASLATAPSGTRRAHLGRSPRPVAHWRHGARLARLARWRRGNRLVRNEQADWFEPPLAVAAIHIGDRAVRPVWSGAVRVAGADFDHLHGHIQLDGAVQGWATVTGIWSGDHLQVERQTPQAPEPVRLPHWTVPPCPPPPGGWPDVISGGDSPLHYDIGDLRVTGALIALTLFRPAQRKAVLVATAADRAAVEARLRPQLADCLCRAEPVDQGRTRLRDIPPPRPP
jgi:hypothetical protein